MSPSQHQIERMGFKLNCEELTLFLNNLIEDIPQAAKKGVSDLILTVAGKNYKTLKKLMTKTQPVFNVLKDLGYGVQETRLLHKGDMTMLEFLKGEVSPVYFIPLRF